MPALAPSLPDLRAQFEAQADFLNQVSHHSFDTIAQLSALAMREIAPAAEGWRSWQGSLMHVLSASGATLARDTNDGSGQAARSATGAAGGDTGAEDVGAAHNPT